MLSPKKNTWGMTGAMYHRDMEPVGVSTLDAVALRAVVEALGMPAWRTKQVREAVWRPTVRSFDDALQLPVALRTALGQRLCFSTLDIVEESEADSGATIKLLCSLGDGQTVETVAMESPATDTSRRRSTVCVSSQVGCAIGCPFCMTGQMGLRRNCTAAEIVDQVRAAATVLCTHGLGPVTHVVFMGMGEPLANYTEVVGALRVLTRDAGISARRLTVSTSGVAPAIERLAGEGLAVTLAISLHAATNELRSRLVPTNKAYPIERLLVAARRYAEATGRRISLEWCLIGGINDSDDEARSLRDLAHELRAHVNIIPMNHVDGSPWAPPDSATVQRFMDQLRGVRVTFRGSRGATSNAACGQLRATLERRRTVQPDGSLSPPARPSRRTPAPV